MSDCIFSSSISAGSRNGIEKIGTYYNDSELEIFVPDDIFNKYSIIFPRFNILTPITWSENYNLVLTLFPRYSKAVMLLYVATSSTMINPVSYDLSLIIQSPQFDVTNPYASGKVKRCIIYGFFLNSNGSINPSSGFIEPASGYAMYGLTRMGYPISGTANQISLDLYGIKNPFYDG